MYRASCDFFFLCNLLSVTQNHICLWFSDVYMQYMLDDYAGFDILNIYFGVIAKLHHTGLFKLRVSKDYEIIILWKNMHVRNV